MTLYLVTNGYMADGDVGVLLEADTPEQAEAQALPFFKQEVQRSRGSYDSHYYEHLKVEEVELPWYSEFQ